MSNNTTRKLVRMQEDIQSAKGKAAEGEGVLKRIHKELKTHGVADKAAANKRIATLDKELDKKEAALATGTEQLEEDYSLGGR